MRDVARLVTLVERDDPAAAAERAAPLAAIEAEPARAGRRVHRRARRRQVDAARRRSPRRSRPTPTRRIAIVAVDPSSAATGGALLGDRTRIRVPEGRVFIRSQASQAESGGLAPTTYPVVRALRRLFDLVLRRDARRRPVGGRHPPRRRRHLPAAAAARRRQRAAPEGGPDGGAGRDRRDEVRRRPTWRSARSPTCDGAIGLARPGETHPAARRQRPHGRRHRRAGRRRRRDAGRSRSGRATTGS